MSQSHNRRREIKAIKAKTGRKHADILTELKRQDAAAQPRLDADYSHLAATSVLRAGWSLQRLSEFEPTKGLAWDPEIIAPRTSAKAEHLAPVVGRIAKRLDVAAATLVLPAHLAPLMSEPDITFADGYLSIEPAPGAPIVSGAFDGAEFTADWRGADETWTPTQLADATLWLSYATACTFDPLIIEQTVAVSDAVDWDQFGGGERDQAKGFGRGSGAGVAAAIEFPCPRLEGVAGWFDDCVLVRLAIDSPGVLRFSYLTDPGTEHWLASCIETDQADGLVTHSDWQIASDAPEGALAACAAIARNRVRTMTAAHDAAGIALGATIGLPQVTPRTRLKRMRVSMPTNPVTPPTAAVVDVDRDIFGREDRRDPLLTFMLDSANQLESLVPEDMVDPLVLMTRGVPATQMAQWMRQYGLSALPIQTLADEIDFQSGLGDFSDRSTHGAPGLLVGSVRYGFATPISVASLLPALAPPAPGGRIATLNAVTTPVPAGSGLDAWADAKGRVQIVGVFHRNAAFATATAAAGATTWARSSVAARNAAPVGIPAIQAYREPGVLYVTTPDGRHPGVPLSEARSATPPPVTTSPIDGDGWDHEGAARIRAEQGAIENHDPEPKITTMDKRLWAEPSSERPLDIRVNAMSTSIPVFTSDAITSRALPVADLLAGARAYYDGQEAWTISLPRDLGAIKWFGWDLNVPRIEWLLHGATPDEEKRLRAWVASITGDLVRMADTATALHHLAIQLVLGWRANNERSTWEQPVFGEPNDGFTKTLMKIRHDPLVQVKRWVGLDLGFAKRSYSGMPNVIIDIDTEQPNGYIPRPIVANVIRSGNKAVIVPAPGIPPTIMKSARNLYADYDIADKVGHLAMHLGMERLLGIPQRPYRPGAGQ